MTRGNPAALLAALAMTASLQTWNAQAETIVAGEALYEAYCQTCHGDNGDGKGPATVDMDRNPRSFATAAFKFDTDADWRNGTATDLADVIRNGAEPYGGSPLMPAWGQSLSEEEIAALVAFIQSLKKAGHW